MIDSAIPWVRSYTWIVCQLFTRAVSYPIWVAILACMSKQRAKRLRERPESPARFRALDALRGLTVILAMLDHVKIQFVPDFHTLIPLTRLATPCFIILFGAMIEIAYLSKIRQGRNVHHVKTRLISRALTCWGLALLLTGAAVLSGNLGFEPAVKSLIGLDFGRFTEIFLIYAALFLLLIAMFRLTARYGSVPILCVATIGWALKPAMATFIADPSFFTTFTLGVGMGYGPALLPALTLVGFGLAVGETLTARRRAGLAIFVIFVAALVAIGELSHGPIEAGRRFLAHRWINHSGYYAVGILAFSCLLILFHRIDHYRIVDGPMRALATVGTQTLFVYGAGNFVLNLMPMIQLHRLTGFLVALLFMMVLIALALIGPKGRNAMGFGLPALLKQRYSRLMEKLTQHLLPISR